MKALIIVTTEAYKEKLWDKCLNYSNKDFIKVDNSCRMVEEVSDLTEANVIRLNINNDRFALVMFHGRSNESTTSFLVTLLESISPEPEVVYIAGRKGFVNWNDMLADLPMLRNHYAEFWHDRQISSGARLRLFDALEQFALAPGKENFDQVCDLIEKS